MEIEEFFARYARALTSGDADEVASCYGCPSMVLADGAVFASRERHEVRSAFAGAGDAFRAREIVRAVPAFETVSPITGRLADVEVRWTYLDAAGAVRGVERIRYLLRAEDGCLAIHVVISVEPPTTPDGRSLV
ncbi:hypothetical protein JNUCC0626_08030 [Lentzea sp. JNUCC 0626]|uniref:hypothetical protein n=1 Tax=Lentzea sp. JNUCC 0626 TaxID=3367513 RepID=UPI0037481E03